uniref:Transposase n=1 Tax=Ditylenchus dipsaci TaxID=166011 RepID=A0A915EEH5_9BILA
MGNGAINNWAIGNYQFHLDITLGNGIPFLTNDAFKFVIEKCGAVQAFDWRRPTCGVKWKEAQAFVLLPRKRPDLAIVENFGGKLELRWKGTMWMNDELILEYLDERSIN